MLRRIRLKSLNSGTNHERLMPIEQCVYFFTPRAVSGEWIFVEWAGRYQPFFPSGKICVRTRDGVFATRFNSLEALQRHFELDALQPASQSVVVNFDHVTGLNLGAGDSTVLVAVARGTEVVRLSRRCRSDLLKHPSLLD